MRSRGGKGMGPAGTGSGHTVPAPSPSPSALTQASGSGRPRRTHTLAAPPHRVYSFSVRLRVLSIIEAFKAVRRGDRRGRIRKTFLSPTLA